MPEKRPRILALDLLRGYFLVVILIDHLGLFPSPFELITGRGNLWASAAEGFFLISGLLVGYVYTPRMMQGFKAVAVKIWKRAFPLYVWAVVLTWIFVWWGHFVTPAYVSGGLWQNPSLGEFLYKTLTLQYIYGWADFLRYYAIYMLLAPIALWLCARGKAWLVLLLSIMIWLLSMNQFIPAWQLLFMMGIVVGYYFPRLQAWYWSRSAVRRRQIAWSLGLTTVSTIMFSALTNRLAVYFTETYASLETLPVWLQASTQWLYGVREFLRPWTLKDSLEPLRLLTALVWFTAFYMFTRRFEVVINRLSRGWLKVFGENSLLVYITQSFVVFGLLAFVKPGSILANTVITAMSLVAVYVFARYHQQLVSLIRPRKASMPGQAE